MSLTKKSQAATEMIIILAVALFVLLIMISVNSSMLNTTGNDFRNAKAKAAINDIAEAAEMVYQQGVGSKSKIYISVPNAIAYSNVSDRKLSIKFTDNTDVYRSVGFVINGTIPIREGFYWVNIESMEGYVWISVNSSNTSSVSVDMIPPLAITNLRNTSFGTTWIYWEWNNPSDPDFSRVAIYINGSSILETSNSYYNATGLTPDTSYVIKIFTKDSSGNINTTNVNNTATTRDVIPPLAVTNLNNQSSGPTWIYWNWTNPTAPDFYQTIIYIDGTNVANLTAPINYYNATGLSSLTNYTIIINTMDTDINVNTTNVNNTAITKAAPDLTPPMAVTNLANKSSGTDWIYWNWTNPADVDFFEAIIYINGTNIANTSNNYYNATGLNPSSSYIIKVLTMDNSGNINTTNVNSTAVTQAPDLTPPLAITNLRNQSSGQDWIYWNWTNPTAPDFSVAIIYINGTNVANTSNNYYNATGLSFGSSYIIRVNTKDTSGNVNLTNVTNVSRTQPYVLPDALMVFASSTTSEINYSKYNSGAWGAISTTSYTPNSMIGYVVVKEAPTRDEYIVVTSDANNDVYARIFSNGNWHDQQVISLNANGLYRGFDVAYERTSGDALVVANNGSSNFTYYIWNGVSWSGPNNYSTTATGAEPYWIQLAEDPFSDEIAMMSLHSNSRVFAAIWNGNAFGNNQTLTTTAGSATTESIALAYEQLSGEAMFTWNNAATTTTINYRQWTGAAWGTASSFTITAAGGGTRWAKLAENSSSNALMYGQTDSASDLNTRQWSGTAWDAAHTEHSASVDSITSRCFDIAYETYIANGNALIIFAPNNNDAISISEYRGATTWTALTAYDPYAESTDKQVIRIVSGNGITEYMDADDGLDMNHWYFTESSEAWTSAGTSLGEISFDVYANREWFDAAFKR